jgi:hypothetical protein
VSITEVYRDKIQTLAQAFQGYKEESLNALMEKTVINSPGTKLETKRP